MIKILVILISLFVFSGCTSSKTNKRNFPDALVIYKLPQFSTYLLNVNCNDVKKRVNVSTVVITDKQIVKEYFLVFNNDNLFILDTLFATTVDSRILFEFKKNNVILSSFCWGNPGRLERNGSSYLYNEDFENFLLKKKHIIKINMDGL